jgi:hypothetical protein
VSGPIVQVTFDPQRTPAFTFVDDTVRMNAAGKIMLKQDPEARWRFRGATIKDDYLNEFRTRVAKNGKSLDIMDDFLDERITTYSYNVTVQLDDITYTSPDPVIVNDPGGFAP